MAPPAFSDFADALRSGAFLDRARVRRLAVVYLLVGLASVGALLATSDGFLDRLGRPLGTDFMAFHVAGTIAGEAGGAAAYDSDRQYAEHQERLGAEDPPFWPYLYPPAFLFIAIPLAGLPYLAAWLAFMGGGLALYAAAMQRLAPGAFALLLTLAFPPVLTNFLHGQTGFLIAALFAGGLHFLFGGRPILAGLAFGLIAIKPQYGVLLPIALAAGGHWRTFAAAAATVAAGVAAPTLIFGAEVWPPFFETMRAARVEILEAGAIGFEKIQSVFSQARMLGAPVFLAYSAQALVLLAAGFFAARLWRGTATPEIKGAGLIILAIIATPYAVDYDLVILAPALAFLIRDGQARGFGPYEKAILLLAAAAPIIARPVGEAAHVSAGLAALAALLWVVRRRDGGGPSPPPSAPISSAQEAFHDLRLLHRLD